MSVREAVKELECRVMRTTAKDKWARLRTYTKEARAEQAPPCLFVSRNDKTGISLNVAMIGSCRPTRLCYRVCYGLSGPVSMVNAVKMYTRNLRRLKVLVRAPQAEVDLDANIVAYAVRAADQDFLRVNGVGDLVPGTVQLVEALIRLHPWLKLWISTRKPELAIELPAREPVHTMLSMDKTTQAKDRTAMRTLIAQGRGSRFLSYVQTGPDDEPPPDASVVFAEHRGSSRAKWRPHPRACGASIREGFDGYIPHQGQSGRGACSECRRCFDRERREAA